jgi:hypothetical protein
MIGDKKDAPEMLKKWEQEHKISSYRWVDTFVTTDTGETVRTGSVRTYGIGQNGELVRFPKEIKEYFEKRAVEKKAEKAAKAEKK